LETACVSYVKDCVGTLADCPSKGLVQSKVEMVQPVCNSS